jgi:hypothetical protein
MRKRKHSSTDFLKLSLPAYRSKSMKLSPAIKKQITTDWKGCFPNFGIYKPMWLLRGIGPLVSGICLERDSGNDAYRPTLHVHNLAKQSATVSLTLADPLRTVKTGGPQTIRAAFHQQLFRDAAGRLNQQAHIPLNGAVRLEHCVQAYRAYMEQPLARYAWHLFDDVVTLFAWCGHKTNAETAIVEFARKMGDWPTHLHPPDGIEAWVTQRHACIENPELVKETVRSQTRVLQLEHLPYLDIQC